MKITKIFILSLIIVSTSFCSSQKMNKADSKNNQTEISSIKYTTFTRGFKDEIRVNSETAEYEVIIGEPNQKNIKRKMSETDWQEIEAALENLDVENISQYEVPSTDSYSDKGYAAVLEINKNGQTYFSQQFDKANPPKEFLSLINKMEKVLRRN